MAASIMKVSDTKSGQLSQLELNKSRSCGIQTWRGAGCGVLPDTHGIPASLRGNILA